MQPLNNEQRPKITVSAPQTTNRLLQQVATQFKDSLAQKPSFLLGIPPVNSAPQNGLQASQMPNFATLQTGPTEISNEDLRLLSAVLPVDQSLQQQLTSRLAQVLASGRLLPARQPEY